MINLVTIKRAERHLRLDIDETTTVHIPDLEFKIQQASEIILNYLKIPVPEHTSPVEDSPTYTYWENNPSAIPFDVQAATLLVLGTLWESREANVAGSFVGSTGVLTDAVKSLLHRRRDPALA